MQTETDFSMSIENSLSHFCESLLKNPLCVIWSIVHHRHTSMLYFYLKVSKSRKQQYTKFSHTPKNWALVFFVESFVLFVSLDWHLPVHTQIETKINNDFACKILLLMSILKSNNSLNQDLPALLESQVCFFINMQETFKP